jgi:hypothetical protein
MTADFWRILVCSQAAFAAGLAFYVFIYYCRPIHVTPLVLRRHVLCISLSYCILSGMVALEVASRFDQPLSYRTPLGFLAFALGDYSLCSIFRYVYKRDKAGP